ncbi:MAG: hypothetical protein CVU56_28460 [Deltaproteobacteria bacterium HGW-Deltaproteobacteria-14]|jgi:hypothetical protein|nr:MAG: hypothetical protein CVU56_28460 [Deltaproteobacteria bacterium HGW-Deltaproteobacteria-14]
MPGLRLALARPLTIALTTALTIAISGAALALDLTDRNVDVAGKLDVKSASTLSDKLIKLDADSDRPIFLMITATEGSAQGVMIVADTIRSLKSPVVGVVLTQVHDAGAALAPFTDRVLMFPSAGLVFTEVDYEGVKKPEPPAELKPGETPPKVKAPTPTELMLQGARERFLGRFYGRLAKRLNMKADALKAAIDAGGLMLGVDEAVAQKIAYAVVDQLTFTTLPTVKTEVKVVTTRKDTKIVTPEGGARD